MSGGLSDRGSKLLDIADADPAAASFTSERISETVAEDVERHDGEEDRDAWWDGRPDRAIDADLGVSQHATPARLIGTGADTEKAQCSLGQHCLGEQQRRLHDQRRSDVGQDVRPHDPGVGRASCPCPIDVQLFASREHLGSGEPGDDHRVHQSDRQHGLGQPVPRPVMIAMAITTAGTATTVSTSRITMRSTQPRK